MKDQRIKWKQLKLVEKSGELVTARKLVGKRQKATSPKSSPPRQAMLIQKF